MSCLVSLIVNDLLKSLGRSNMFFYLVSMIVMIFYKASDVQICYYMVSVIANDFLQSLGRPNMFFICFLWSSMIFYKASVVQKLIVFGLHDRKWSSSTPRSPKNESSLVSMIVNDLPQRLCRPKMYLVWSSWSSMIFYKASVAKICVFFRLNDRQWYLL